MQGIGLLSLLAPLGAAESRRLRTPGWGREVGTPGLEPTGALAVIESDAGVVGNRDGGVRQSRARAVRVQGRGGASVAVVVGEEVVCIDAAVHAIVPDVKGIGGADTGVIYSEHEGDGFSLVIGGVVAVEVPELPAFAYIGPLSEPELGGGPGEACRLAAGIAVSRASFVGAGDPDKGKKEA